MWKVIRTLQSFVPRSATWLRRFRTSGCFGLGRPAGADSSQIRQSRPYQVRLMPGTLARRRASHPERPEARGRSAGPAGSRRGPYSRLGRVVGQRRYFLSIDGPRFFQADIFQLSEPPNEATRQRLGKGTWPSFGPAGAPVTWKVFADLPCPDCAAESRTTRELLPAEFPKQVKVQFRDYPSSNTTQAMNAAIAGRSVLGSGPPSVLGLLRLGRCSSKGDHREQLPGEAEPMSKDKKLDLAFRDLRCQRSIKADLKKRIADGLALEVSGLRQLYS